MEPRPTDASPESDEAFADFVPRSGVDYALRTIQQSQVQFSLMADAKSNIMITVCSIVVSASLTQLHRPELLRPIVVLDVFTIVALIAAILCVLPARANLLRVNGDVDRTARGFNPLFFMHFQHLEPDEFARELEARFSTSGSLYRSLVRDIYAGGVVLGRGKYRYLRISYVAFLIGLVGGMATFAAERMGVTL